MYYTAMEASKDHFDAISGHVQNVLKQISEKTGRHYEIMEYHGAADAEVVMVIMGCSALTAECVIEKYNEQNHSKFGVMNIRLWKPFDMKYFASKLPKTCKKVIVMDRSRDFQSAGELLYKEVLTTCFKQNLIGEGKITRIVNATYGICGIDLTPGDILAAFTDTSDRNCYRIGVNCPE